MKRLVTFTLIIAASANFASKAQASGADFTKQELDEKGEIVKGQKPVHGYWVNWENMFFYSGDTIALNRFIKACAKVENSRVRIVIHPGAKKARSPWDKADRDIPVDWSLCSWNAASDKSPPSQIDVWLGNRITLDNVRVPANVEVVSGGEIERFISYRKKK